MGWRLVCELQTLCLVSKPGSSSFYLFFFLKPIQPILQKSTKSVLYVDDTTQWVWCPSPLHFHTSPHLNLHFLCTFTLTSFFAILCVCVRCVCVCGKDCEISEPWHGWARRPWGSHAPWSSVGDGDRDTCRIFQWPFRDNLPCAHVRTHTHRTHASAGDLLSIFPLSPLIHSSRSSPCNWTSSVLSPVTYFINATVLVSLTHNF